mgnify:CR=1 FL=1
MSTQLLLDTLVGDSQVSNFNWINDDEGKSMALSVLDEMLNSPHLESLLDTTITPGMIDPGNTIIEQIAELSNESLMIDKEIALRLCGKDNSMKDLKLMIDANNTYIESFETLDSIISYCEDMIEENPLSSWIKEIPNLNKNQESKNTSHNSNNDDDVSKILYNLDNVIQILELPSITNTLIKSANYSECIEISSFIQRLSIRYNDLEIISHIKENVSYEINDMVKRLSNLLSGNLKQSSIMKIMSYLKRIIPDKWKLKTIFLNLRYKFIIDEFDTLIPLKNSKLVEKYLKRVLEVFREFTFQTVITFESIFDKDTEMIHSFIISIVNSLMNILDENLINIKEESIDSTILQLLYCSQSLARVGGDFTSILLHRLPNPLTREQILTTMTKQRHLVRTLNH